MNWINLQNLQQLDEIKSAAGFSIIFKHSTRCSISMMAKRKFELDADVIPENTPLYFLDLIQHRMVSNMVAEMFSVYHESPQLLLIRDGECIYDTSHGDISAEEAAEQMGGGVYRQGQQ